VEPNGISPFKPGLAGGHCCSIICPKKNSRKKDIILKLYSAGRRLNDSMGEYVASQVVKLMIKKGITLCQFVDAGNHF
jgi:UDP-N-acetyl-D-galactosamine dehydrogenase